MASQHQIGEKSFRFAIYRSRYGTLSPCLQVLRLSPTAPTALPSTRQLSIFLFDAVLPKEVPSGRRQNVMGLKNMLPLKGTYKYAPLNKYHLTI